MNVYILDEVQIHKIAYLSSRGWVPTSGVSDRCAWELVSSDDPDKDAWYASIDDAYAYQRELDGRPLKEGEDVGR